jgi:hypothetical protein
LKARAARAFARRSQWVRIRRLARSREPGA